MESFIFLAKSTGVLSLFYLVYYCLLRHNTHFTAIRFYFLSGATASILVPFIQLKKNIFIELPSQPSSLPALTTTDLPVLITSQNDNPLLINWWQVALFIYLAGLFIMLLRMSIQLYAVWRLIASGTPLNCHSRFITLEQSISPFSFLSYIVYNPTLHSSEELQMILAHEKIHTQQWHSMDTLFINIILAIQWCNPIAWFYRLSLEQNLEFIADNHAIQQVNNPQEYQHALLKVSSPIYGIALTSQFFKSFVKKRIIMLNTPQSRKKNLWKFGVVLPFLAVFMYSFNTKEIIVYVEEDTSAFAKAPLKKNSPNKTLENSIRLPSKDKKTKKTGVQSVTQTPFSNSKKNSDTSNLASQTGKKMAHTIKNEAHLKQGTSGLSENKLLQQTYRFTITKNTTLQELKDLKKELKNSYGATLNYDSIAYNDAGEMVSIRLDFKDASGNNKNYTIQSSSPIANIYIYREADGSTGMGNISSSQDQLNQLSNAKERMSLRREAMMQKRDSLQSHMDSSRKEMKMRTAKQQEIMTRRGMILRRHSDSTRASRELMRDSLRARRYSQRDTLRGRVLRSLQDSLRSQHLALLYKNSVSGAVQRNNDNIKQTALRLAKSNSASGKDPLIFLNDKPSSLAKIEALSPDEIDNVSVLKGKVAIKLYGKKAKDGVILIETKE